MTKGYYVPRSAERRKTQYPVTANISSVLSFFARGDDMFMTDPVLGGIVSAIWGDYCFNNKQTLWRINKRGYHDNEVS